MVYSAGTFNDHVIRLLTNAHNTIRVQEQGQEQVEGLTSMELVVLSLIGLIALQICAWSTMQGRNIGRGDHDLMSHGQQIRRWFMYMIAVASGMRVLCTLTKGVTVYLRSYFIADDKSAGNVMDTLLALLPSLFYFTLYSLLTVYFAQLCYTAMGQTFFHVRNVFLSANILLYAIVIVELLFFQDLSVIYMICALAFAFNLVVVLWFGIGLFNHFPADTSIDTGKGNVNSTGHSPPERQHIISNNHNPSSNSANVRANVQLVKTRLLPLVIACVVGLSMEMFHAVLLFTNYTKARDITTDSIFVLCSELLPSVVFLYFVGPKSEENSEESSLLHAAGRSAANGAGSKRGGGYRSIDDRENGGEGGDDGGSSFNAR